MEDGGWDDFLGLPTSNRDQLCASRGAGRPTFAHRLNPAKVQFRSYGKGHTLPTFWPVCEGCEDLVARQDDEVLLRRMRVHHSSRMSRTSLHFWSPSVRRISAPRPWRTTGSCLPTLTCCTGDVMMPRRR